MTTDDMQPPYQLLAAVHAVHTDAASAADTDWAQVLALHDRLLELTPGPVVGRDRAVALAGVDGPQVALADVDRLVGRLSSYDALHATRADLLRRLGRAEEARAADDAALALSDNAAERAFLCHRRAGLRPGPTP